MITATARMIKRVNSNSYILWGIVLSFAIIMGIAIADKKWLYYGVVISPLIIYLCIHKPFIFPLGAYAFLVPFDALLSVMGSAYGGATLTKFLGVLTILVLSLKGAFENKLKKPDAASIWWILFITYGLLSVCWAINPERALSKIPTAVGLLLLYLVASSYQINKREYETLKWLILAGGFLAAIFTIYNYTTGQLYYGEQRSTVNLAGRMANPNAIAFSLLIPVAICIAMILRKNVMRFLYIFVLAIMLFGIVATGSRSSMLGIAAIFIVYILLMRQISFCTILIIIGVIIFSFLPDFFIARWESSLETGGSGRLGIWYVGWKSLEKYWMFGAGLKNFTVAFDEFAHYSPSLRKSGYASHNLYLGMFVQLGIIGITFMVMAIRKHYKALKSQFVQCNVDIVILKASFWATLVFGIFGENIWSKSFWLLWIMIIMYKNISEDKLKEQHSYNHRADVVSSEQ